MSAEMPPLTPAQALETQQPQLIALCTVMLVLSMSALGLRLWSNYIATNHRWGWDDFFAIITLVCFFLSIYVFICYYSSID
jgi:hypothetical protein